MQTIRNNVMRRVYYAYALSLATHRVTLHAVLGVAALYILGRLVFVAAVINNFLSIPVGQVPSFVLAAFLNADFLTLVTVAACGLIAVSFMRNMKTTPMSSEFRFA